MADETEDTNNRRRSSLTESDLLAISAVIKQHSTCNMGLSVEEAAILKRGLTMEEISVVKKFLAAFSKAEGIVGRLVLTSIVLIVIGIVTKGFWASIASGINHGVTK